LSPPAFEGRSRRGHKDGRFHPRSNIPRRTEPSFFKESRSSSRAQPRTHNADSWRRRPGFACVRPHARVGVGSPGKNPSVGGVGSLSRVDRGASVSDSRRSRGPTGPARIGRDVFQGPGSSGLDRTGGRDTQNVRFRFETDSSIRLARQHCLARGRTRRQEAQRIVVARVMSSVENSFDARRDHRSVIRAKHSGRCAGARHPIALGAIAHEDCCSQRSFQQTVLPATREILPRCVRPSIARDEEFIELLELAMAHEDRLDDGSRVGSNVGVIFTDGLARARSIDRGRVAPR
jgi:hypothetical protein